MLEKKQREGGVVLKISNKEGWCSEADILKYPSVKRLFRRLMPLIESYAQMMGLDSKYLTISAWANINRNTDSNLQHAYEHALFSGCYYLKGGFKSSLENGGISFFKKSEEKNILATFSPEPGDFLLFPSDMLCSAQPYEGSDRISIAFNVHFGNRKKSWRASNSDQSESMQKLDPFHELSGQKNAAHYVDSESGVKSMLFHSSKIKRKFIK